MPDRDEATKQSIGTDPTMRTFAVFLVFFAVVLLLLALGLTWKGLLHWTGELLLIIGILLAAKGISDVRREWTGRPGIWRSIKHQAQSIRVRATAFLWVRWNRLVEKRPGLARWLHLHIHPADVVSADAG
jgi:hypothetical protein